VPWVMHANSIALHESATQMDSVGREQKCEAAGGGVFIRMRGNATRRGVRR
jgi:hypothetical protein